MNLKLHTFTNFTLYGILKLATTWLFFERGIQWNGKFITKIKTTLLMSMEK